MYMYLTLALSLNLTYFLVLEHKEWAKRFHAGFSSCHRVEACSKPEERIVCVQIDEPVNTNTPLNIMMKKFVNIRRMIMILIGSIPTSQHHLDQVHQYFVYCIKIQTTFSITEGYGVR